MYGNFSEMEENTWVGKKYIHVNSGGVFEIHGKEKFGFKIERMIIKLILDEIMLELEIIILSQTKIT